MDAPSSVRTKGDPRRFWTATHAFLVALLAVVVSFVASAVFAESRAAGIDAAAISIAENAAPSVEHLAAARADIRRLQALLADYVNDAVLGRAGDLGGVAQARSDLSRDVEAYLELPPYPGERKLWQNVSTELAALDGLNSRVLSLVSQGHAAQANELADTEVRASFDRANEALMASIGLNARQAHALARTIEESRERSRRIAFALDGLSILLAVLAGGAAVAFAKRHERLLGEHTRLVEERAHELDQFAARVAHDIAGPLATVLFANRLVSRKIDGDPSTREHLARCARAAQRAQEIVDGLLDFARTGAKPEPGAWAEVRAVIRELVADLEPVAREAAAEIVCEPCEAYEVAASPGVLTSLISNLARNAIKYLGDALVRRVVLRVVDARDAVRVEVKDTGPGVPPALEGIIFQPYVRGPGTRETGLGLGLATVKSLAEAHGGRVGVRSSIGRGSTFWFELPKATRARSAPSTGDAPTHPP